MLGEKYGVLAAILISTLVLFVFAEMTPKAIGAASPVTISRAVAIPLSWMMTLLAPIATLCVRITTGALRFFRITEKAPALTEEEMKSVFNLGADQGVIHGEERRLLHKVLEFGDKTARDIMTPRTRVVALPETAKFPDVAAVLKEHKLSRLPIYRGSLDNVVGVLNAKDLFALSDEDEKTFRIDQYMDQPFLVPEFKHAEDVFREMRRRRTHIAVVVDEFGGTAGIVTIEDAIEEMLGPHPGRVRRGGDAGLRGGGRARLPARGELPARRPRGAVRPRPAARGGRDDRRPPDAPVRPDPAQGRALEGRKADFIIEDATPTTVKAVRMILPPEEDDESDDRKMPRITNPMQVDWICELSR